jgi:hypothetical protein
VPRSIAILTSASDILRANIRLTAWLEKTSVRSSTAMNSIAAKYYFSRFARSVIRSLRVDWDSDLGFDRSIILTDN